MHTPQNIHFAGRLMGVHCKDKSCPIDHEAKILIYGNTPLKFEDALLWTFRVTGIATESEFAQSKLAETHQNVTFSLRQFAENCYTEFRLLEDCTQEINEMRSKVNRGAHQIADVWPGHPEVFIQLFGMTNQLNYSLYHDFEDGVELEFLRSLRDEVATRATQRNDKLTARDEAIVLGKFRGHLGVEDATVEALLEAMDNIIANPPQGVDGIQIIRRLRYLEGCGSYCHPVTLEYHANRRKAHAEFLLSQYEKDREFVIEAVMARLLEWQKDAAAAQALSTSKLL